LPDELSIFKQRGSLTDIISTRLAVKGRREGEGEPPYRHTEVVLLSPLSSLEFAARLASPSVNRSRPRPADSLSVQLVPRPGDVRSPMPFAVFSDDNLGERGIDAAVDAEQVSGERRGHRSSPNDPRALGGPRGRLYRVSVAVKRDGSADLSDASGHPGLSRQHLDK